LSNTIAKPFLKWAGGKGQLLEKLDEHFPPEMRDGKIKKYVEPFLGGGALFFYLISKFNFEEIILNDINRECILTYKVIQNNVEKLIELLSQMESNFLSMNDEQRKIIYYEQRDIFNEEKMKIDYAYFTEQWIEHAARMIFLNKTCFNGLYRQNSKGQFNVPMGNYKNPTICDEKNLRAVCKGLKGVKLLNGDFQNLINYIDENTFVYMDPPYRPLNNTSNFSGYSKEPFNDESQIRLSKWFKELSDNKKAKLMLSNSDPTNSDPEDDFFDKLYAEFKIDRVTAVRAINSKGSGRGAIRELIITNY
jgi:DNA adenine methylase